MKSKILPYLLAVFLFTFSLNFALYRLGGLASPWARVLLPLQMLIPGIVAFFFISLRHESFSRYGIRWGAFRYYVMAYFLMVGIHGMHTLLHLVLNLGRWVEITPFIERFNLGSSSATLPQILTFLFVVGPLLNAPTGIGEEIGWRGYLLNHMLSKGLSFAIVINGLIWTLWHLPLILMGHNFPGMPLVGLMLFAPAAIFMSAILIWLRLKSKSVIVSGFAHGVFNTTIHLGGLFVPEAGILLANPIGLIGIPLMAAISLGLYRWSSPQSESDLLKEACD